MDAGGPQLDRPDVQRNTSVCLRTTKPAPTCCSERQSGWPSALASRSALLPFAAQFYAEPSAYVFHDAEGAAHEIAQGEGGEQGDPLMPALYALGQHPALLQAHAALTPGEDLLRVLGRHLCHVPGPPFFSFFFFFFFFPEALRRVLLLKAAANFTCQLLMPTCRELLHLPTSHANLSRVTSPANFSCQLVESYFTC